MRLNKTKTNEKMNIQWRNSVPLRRVKSKRPRL